MDTIWTAEGDASRVSGVVRQRLAACQAMNLPALEDATGRGGEAIRQALETMIAAGEVDVLEPIVARETGKARPGRVFYRLRRDDDGQYLWEQALDEPRVARPVASVGLEEEAKPWWWRPRERAFAAPGPLLGWAQGA